ALSPFPTVPSGFQALALCDFSSSLGVATVLRMGEQLCILFEDGKWWLVASKVSGKECHIPSSCVAKIRHSARCLHRYEGISRQKAEELLLHLGNHNVSFLIQESQTRQGCYSPSLCCGKCTAWALVIHYCIRRLDNGWLYISPRLTIPSLDNLVDHYSEFSKGLCCPLSEPCSMGGPRPAPAPTALTVVKKPSLHWDKIESSLLFSETTSPPEDSPISHGLREATSFYLILSETDTPGPGSTRKVVKNS
ncbi:SLAP2 protein, partial [Chloropsis cyanopogon]|nr:SLAP2 protein [Chloropsis cyanopogon]